MEENYNDKLNSMSISDTAKLLIKWHDPNCTDDIEPFYHKDLYFSLNRKLQKIGGATTFFNYIPRYTCGLRLTDEDVNIIICALTRLIDNNNDTLSDLNLPYN